MRKTKTKKAQEGKMLYRMIEIEDEEGKINVIESTNIIHSKKQEELEKWLEFENEEEAKKHYGINE